MKRLFAALCMLPLLALTIGPVSLARPGADDDDDDSPAGKRVIMDDPRQREERARRAWESIQHTPYSEAVAYAQGQQAQAGRAAGSLATLPTGWKIMPAGAQVSVGKLPFHAVAFNGSVVVIDSGYSNGPQDFAVVDPLSATRRNTIPVQNLFPRICM